MQNVGNSYPLIMLELVIKIFWHFFSKISVRPVPLLPQRSYESVFSSNLLSSSLFFVRDENLGVLESFPCNPGIHYWKVFPAIH